MRATVSNLVTHRLITPSGVTRSFCGDPCRNRWLVANGARDHGATRDDTPVRVRQDCQQCAWCGLTIAVPIDCLRHPCGDGSVCPDYDVLATDTGGRAVRRLRQLAGRDLPDRCFDYLEKAAECFRHDLVPCTAQMLVERVMDVRADWLW